MPIKITTTSTGAKGLANVVVAPQLGKVTVAFLDGSHTGMTFEILLDDAPTYIRSGRQNVTLNADGTQIRYARPSQGTYACRLVKFASAEDEPPEPKVVEERRGNSSKTGKKYYIPEHLEFTPIFEIITGDWKGYQLTQNLNYIFYPYEETPGVIQTEIKGSGIKKLLTFLDVCGFNMDMDDIPFSENVLPYLEKLLLSRNKVVTLQINESGWVTQMSEVPDGMTFNEEPVQVATQEDIHAGVQKIKAETKAEVIVGADNIGKEKPKFSPMIETVMNLAKTGDAQSIRMLQDMATAGNDEAARAIEFLGAA